MTSFSNIFILFLCAFFYQGNADYIPDELIERIQAIEQREKLQISHLEFLEHQVSDYKTELETLHEAHINLRQDLTDTMNQLHDKNEAFEEVKRDLEDMKQKTYRQQETIANFQAELTQLKKIEVLKDSAKDEPKQIRKILNHEQREDDEEKKKLLKSILGYNSTDEDGQSEIVHVKETFGNSFDVLHEQSKNDRIKRSLIRQNKQLNQKVAFHAVVTPSRLDHLGTHETIRFDKVFLNLGNSYHNQHGIFIAPRSGLYLFSVTIATKETDLWADFVKNGSKLVSILGYPPATHDQGSVTVVTHLNTGDEVWVIHVHPSDGSIWGNYYTSFCGVLLE